MPGAQRDETRAVTGFVSTGPQGFEARTRGVYGRAIADADGRWLVAFRSVMGSATEPADEDLG